MNPNKLFLPAIIAGVALLGGAMFVLGRNSAPEPSGTTRTSESAPTSDESAAADEEKGKDEAILFSPESLKTTGIEVAPVSLRAQVSGLPFNGQIEASPDNVARVASVVPGRITRLFVSLGQNVKRGQTLALVESRGIGEAQSAYAQAVARLQNARGSYDVTLRQARAGVFSRAPLEAAQRAQVEAASDVRAGETAVRQAGVVLDNVSRLAKAGTFARPSLEAARGQYAAALESVQSAQAAQSNASASVRAAQSELARRRQIARGGGYNLRPVEEARRALVAAQSARATAQSEVATTRANLARAKSLAAEGLVSTRDLEAAQTAFDTATARLSTTSADESAATSELERQQKLGSSNVAGSAEVGEAQARLAQAQADEKTRRAEVARASEGLRLANLALNRERTVFGGNIANRREFSTANGNLENARNALSKARQTLAVTGDALERERLIYRQNLNNAVQVQGARAALVSAQSDLRAAQTALSLLKSAPDGSAVVPLRSPLSGIVQVRDVTQGEVIEADKNLMTIVNLSTVHVDMQLPERDLSRVSVGALVSVHVDAVPGQTFSGRIELINSELDPKTRTVEAHARLHNPSTASGYVLKPGMFARGTIGTGSSRLVIMVPADAVQDMDGKQVVFIAGKKAGEFQAREVETGATNGGQTLIKSGLKPGERVVFKGAFMVKAQGMKGELGAEE